MKNLLNLGLSAKSGFLMLMASIAAMVLTNSQAADYYHLLLKTDLGVSLSEYSLSKSVHHWINDGLMAIFFLYIGLELKREVLYGKLSSFKKALLPVLLALGGVIAPVCIYLLFNFSHAPKGWAIPMATDIAFVVAIVSIFRKKVGSQIYILILALAVVDDLVSVLVIAFFYTSSIQFTYLFLSLGGILFLLFLNRMRVHHLWLYLILGGVIVWLPMLNSGVHSTMAGVLLALVIPSRAPLSRSTARKNLREDGEEFLNRLDDGDSHLFTESSWNLQNQIKQTVDKHIPPLQRLEFQLKSLAYLLILPLFAFANMGLEINGNIEAIVTDKVFIGIIAGLVLGKPIGIVSAALIGKFSGVVVLPELSWKRIIFLGFVAGIGFTMALFISDLAFRDQELSNTANLGIVCASIIAMVVSLVLASTLETIEDD